MILNQIVYIKSKCLFQLHGNQMAQTHKHVLNVKLPIKIHPKRVEIRRNEQVETASNGFGFRFKYNFQIK